MVLSACSPYFQSMLYNTPDRHPIVFLRDVRFHEIKALLEFMYRGEVSVDQENLSSLLKVAEGLKIKGLAEVSDGQQQQQQHSPPIPSASVAAVNALSRMPIVSPLPHLENSLSQSQSHLSHSPMKRMASPPSTSTSSSTSGLPKRKRIKPRRLSGSEAVPLASGLAQAVEVARSQQMAKEQAEAAAAMIAASNAVAAAEASIKKDMDGSESSAVARAMDEREEESSSTTKLDGVRLQNTNCD